MDAGGSVTVPITEGATSFTKGSLTIKPEFVVCRVPLLAASGTVFLDRQTVGYRPELASDVRRFFAGFGVAILIMVCAHTVESIGEVSADENVRRFVAELMEYSIRAALLCVLLGIVTFFVPRKTFRIKSHGSTALNVLAPQSAKHQLNQSLNNPLISEKRFEPIKVNYDLRPVMPLKSTALFTFLVLLPFLGIAEAMNDWLGRRFDKVEFVLPGLLIGIVALVARAAWRRSVQGLGEERRRIGLATKAYLKGDLQVSRRHLDSVCGVDHPLVRKLVFLTLVESGDYSAAVRLLENDAFQIPGGERSELQSLVETLQQLDSFAPPNPARL